MNSIFRKRTTPLITSSLFRKGGGGMSSLFKKTRPVAEKILGVTKKASDIANKIVSNPIVEGLAKSQGYGNTFNLAKKGVGSVNKVAEIGSRLQGQTQGLTKAVKTGEDFGNVLERVKKIKDTGDEVRQISFA